MLLFLLRQGDQIYSPDNLTPLSKRQAEVVTKRLALYEIDRNDSHLYSESLPAKWNNALYF